MTTQLITDNRASATDKQGRMLATDLREGMRLSNAAGNIVDIAEGEHEGRRVLRVQSRGQETINVFGLTQLVFVGDLPVPYVAYGHDTKPWWTTKAS